MVNTHSPALKRLLLASIISISALAGCNKNTNDVSLTTPVNPLACHKQPAPGPCRAAVTRYYYDKPLNQCKSFVWGGCKGQTPFSSLKSCKRSCETL